ncbi:MULTISPECIES: GyrI-like domain-containing protein [unclassified Enterococcus]|uniref:GyrI-like domain-containing protein n=1 Tax=unclassified Enterococcus TaxID=2608891 RepID=UPI0013EE3152|nr:MULTISPECIES: GyrI-like domain-containing protein [unclassified Enterococcus]
MAQYTIEEKQDFAVTGVGVGLTSDYTDFVGLAKEKQAFEQKVISDGTMDILKQASENGFFFTVNAMRDHKMMYYAGVETNQELSIPTQTISFPAGNYLVVSGSAESPEELRNDLTNTAFGHVLREVEGYAYVGGPNAVVEMGVTDGKYTGEIWIPVVNKS